MVSTRIREAIEADTRLSSDLTDHGFGSDWKKFNRTTFDFVAQRINQMVSRKISSSSFLLTEHLIIGEDHIQNLLFEKKLKDEETLIHYIAALKRPFHWISGKTLQSYWRGGKAKETKVNVLLVFLGIEIAEWDDWKKPGRGFPSTGRSVRRSAQQHVIKNYFLGSYYLYYQKSDGSDHLIKAPFTIEKDSQGQIAVHTITEGHPYKSSLVELREGILYIHLENQFFNDKEKHIFNVGNETNPEVIFGISNTITVKSKLAIGLRNVLVKQKKHFDWSEVTEKEIPLLGHESTDAEERLMQFYFRQQVANQLQSAATCSLDSLRKMIG